MDLGVSDFPIPSALKEIKIVSEQTKDAETTIMHQSTLLDSLSASAR